MKQTNPEKLTKAKEVLAKLAEARGGVLFDSHRKMANDPELVAMYISQYLGANKTDVTLPRKYRELIIAAIGMATGTATTTRTHSKLALDNGATLDELFEVIRIVFFTCGVTKLLPAMEVLSEMLEPVEE